MRDDWPKMKWVCLCSTVFLITEVLKLSLDALLLSLSPAFFSEHHLSCPSLQLCNSNCNILYSYRLNYKIRHSTSTMTFIRYMCIYFSHKSLFIKKPPLSEVLILFILLLSHQQMASYHIQIATQRKGKANYPFYLCICWSFL